MKVYVGFRPAQGPVEVLIWQGAACRHLDPRRDLRNHSPAGFEWGYLGSGPAQLALAILADATQCDFMAEELYQRFKDACVATWPVFGWTFTEEEICQWVWEQYALVRVEVNGVPDSLPWEGDS